MRTKQQWLELARAEAELSPDPSRKTGCAIVLEDQETAILDHNDFPNGVTVTAARLERPAKYAFMEHAERNALYYAARFGYPTANASIYMEWYPCADCARALVQAGIIRMVCYEPDWSETRYGFRDAEAILKEGGVKVEYES